MKSRREGDTGERGQSPLIGIVLMIGMVAAVSVSLFLVSGNLVTDMEQQSEQERVEQSFVKLSQEMATVSTSGDVQRSMTFDAGKKGAVVKTNTAYFNISGNNVSESIRVGTIEYVGDDGTKIAFQGGGVFRNTGEKTQVVSEPPLEYDHDTHTFSFPILNLEDDAELSSGEISFKHKNSTPYRDSPYVNQSAITVNITSKYCVGWQRYFRGQTNDSKGQAIRETCSEGDDDTLRVRLGRVTLAEGTFEEGIVAGSVSGDTDGVDIVEKDGYAPPELDGMINQMVADMQNNGSVTHLGSVGDTATSGTYFVDNVTVNSTLTFDLEDGNATLVVEDELIVDGGNIHVKNWEQPGDEENHTLQIYVKGGMHVDGGNSEMCVAPCTSSAVDSEYLQVYGTSDTHLAIGTGKAYFEGVIYAPGNGDSWNETNQYINKEGQLVIQSNGEMDGSIVVSSAHIHSNAPEGSYDESLRTFSPEITPDGYVFPPDLSYLNIAEHSVEVKNT